MKIGNGNYPGVYLPIGATPSVWEREYHNIPNHIPDEQIDRYVKAKVQKRIDDASKFIEENK